MQVFKIIYIVKQNPNNLLDVYLFFFSYTCISFSYIILGGVGVDKPQRPGTRNRCRLRQRRGFWFQWFFLFFANGPDIRNRGRFLWFLFFFILRIPFDLFFFAQRIIFCLRWRSNKWLFDSVPWMRTRLSFFFLSNKVSE